MPPTVRPVTSTRILAAAALDASGACASPAQAIVRPPTAPHCLGKHAVELLSLTRAGSPEAAAALRTFAPTATIDAEDSVLTPGFVNAHTHLDLTTVPAIAFDERDGFMGFVRYVLGNRLSEAEAIANAIERGVALSRAGGVVAVGDIAGVVQGRASAIPFASLARTGMLGVSYAEFFGFGAELGPSIDALREAISECERVARASPQLRAGISPHAPYTASGEAYAHAIDLARARGLPMCTHLAENPEERAFLVQASGPFRELHERLGWWSEETAQELGKHQSPIAHLAGALRDQAFLLAHVNDASDTDIAMLAGCNAGVVYSPRSSTYFRNERHFGAHRYLDMLRAGIPVALGTDSVINLPESTTDSATGRLSTLDEARLLRARDGTDALLLLRMLTTYGACVLGLPHEAFLLGVEPSGEHDADQREPGVKAGLVLTRVASGGGNDARGWAEALLASPASTHASRGPEVRLVNLGE